MSKLHYVTIRADEDLVAALLRWQRTKPLDVLDSFCFRLERPAKPSSQRRRSPSSPGSNMRRNEASQVQMAVAA